MFLLAPDILAIARDLSAGVSGAGLAVGLVLWLVGYRGHRFWLVLAVTLTGGFVGLAYGPDFGLQPLVGGLLVAVSAGTLALALARLLLFGAGGVAALALARQLVPSWDEPLVFFLSGGLVGVVLYRFWVTALTSFDGTLVLRLFLLCRDG